MRCLVHVACTGNEKLLSNSSEMPEWHKRFWRPRTEVTVALKQVIQKENTTGPVISSSEIQRGAFRLIHGC
jgi:hypothetical protein